MASTSTTAGQPDTEITSAFDGIAPTSASASASACSSKTPYDIFLNHRGPDVKHTLASDIYDALNAMGFKVFLDSEELDLGDFLPEAIHQAMHTASLHIAILSRRYAQSPWCLAELSFMLKTGTPIIPIFYYVQPDDARWVAKGKGIYVDAFSEHVKKGRYTTQKLDEWKTALHNVSYYTGEIINDNDDMKRVLKNIENRVRKTMKTVPFEAAKHLVCLNEAVKDFESIAPQSGQTQVVGIWGMGGSGKTTLAKELYNQKHSSMQASSFVFDVRDAAASKKLHKKQKKLLQDLGAKDLSFDNIEEGKVILSSRLRSVRVLVVLDDVDHVNQLDALLPTRDGLGRGSLIIVTTRDKEVLRSWDNSTIYKMRTLTHFHAQQLFCWHAFLRPYPLSGFEDLVMKFVDACDGLPLSLKVLGGQLYRESRKEIWQGLLQKISLLVEKDVKQCLKVSYEALDVQDQEAFLDTACFFNGVEKSLAIAVLDESGCGLICWERLVNKCLVEVEDNGLIRMHDHLRDLGREIAASQLPCRLWSPAQIMENQIREQEKIEIRGMVSEIGRALAEQHDLSSGMKLMIKMDTRPEFCGVKRRRLLLNVKIFVVDGDYFNEQMAKVSRELVWLRWSEISHRSLPLWLPFKNLRVLELNGAKNLEELWEDGTDVPVLLTELVITHCWQFRRLPRSIGCLKHLRKIVVERRSRVRNLPEEICLLQSLEHLVLRGSALSSLPNNFGHLTNLRHLDLSYCSELRTLPATFKQLTLLEVLNLLFCKKLTLESDILENMTKLQYLNLQTVGN